MCRRGAPSSTRPRSPATAGSTGTTPCRPPPWRRTGCGPSAGRVGRPPTPISRARSSSRRTRSSAASGTAACGSASMPTPHRLAGSRHGGGAVARAVRHAADHADRPPRRPVHVRKDRDGGHPDLQQRLAGAVPDRAELAAALRHGALDRGGLDREHRRLRCVGEHLSARRRRHQCLNHRAADPIVPRHLVSSATAVSSVMISNVAVIATVLILRTLLICGPHVSVQSPSLTISFLSPMWQTSSPRRQALAGVARQSPSPPSGATPVL